MLNPDLINRLRNWKFTSALRYVDGEVTSEENAVITALAHTFDNCGWMDGEMGTIIGAAVTSLGVEG